MRLGDYQSVLSMVNSGATTPGDSIGIDIGQSKAMYRTAEFVYNYATTASASFASIGLYGVSNVAKFYGTGNIKLGGLVGINQEPATESLECTGNIKINTGNLLVKGARSFVIAASGTGNVYMGNPWYDPANALVENVVYKQL